MMFKSKKKDRTKGRNGGVIRFNNNRLNVKTMPRTTVDEDGLFTSIVEGSPDALIGAVNGEYFSPALLRRRLWEFYNEHNPEKESLDDVIDILIQFAADKGLLELNMKLTDIYGACVVEMVDEDDSDKSEFEPTPPPDEDEPPPFVDSDEDGPRKSKSLRKSLFRRNKTLPKSFDEHSPTIETRSKAGKSVPSGMFKSMLTSKGDLPPPPTAEEADGTEKRKSRKSIFSRKSLSRLKM